MIMSFIIDVGSFVLCNQQSNQVLSLEIITMKYQPSAILIFFIIEKDKKSETIWNKMPKYLSAFLSV